PLRPEMAAWRYGDQFGRRRRRYLIVATAAGLTPLLLSAAQILSGAGMVGVILSMSGAAYQGASLVSRRRTVARVRTGDRILPLTAQSVYGVVLRSSRDHWWELDVPDGPRAGSVIGGRKIESRPGRRRAPRADYGRRPRVRAQCGVECPARRSSRAPPRRATTRPRDGPPRGRRTPRARRRARRARAALARRRGDRRDRRLSARPGVGHRWSRARPARRLTHPPTPRYRSSCLAPPAASTSSSTRSRSAPASTTRCSAGGRSTSAIMVIWTRLASARC